MAQKLLLLEDVEALGRSGDIVNARPGYARNYLLPRGLATIADKNTLRMQARLQEERKKKATIDRKESEELVQKFSDVTLTSLVKVDHEGHMYGSVSALDIANLIQEQAGITLEKRFIQLPHPIKETGVHQIKIKLKEGITTEITLKVVPEEAEGSSAESQGT